MCIMQQIAHGVAFMHSMDVCHRDLKPSNVLVKQGEMPTQKLAVKICDFGSSRRMTVRHGECISIAPTTMWYRAPETLLGEEYTFQIDAWAVGCIWAELIQNAAAFQGNIECEYDQLIKIMQVCGTPTEEQWPGLRDLPAWGDYLPKFRRVLIDLSKSATENAYLDKLMVLCPDVRLSVKTLDLNLSHRLVSANLHRSPHVMVTDTDRRSHIASSMFDIARKYNIRLPSVYLAIRIFDAHIANSDSEPLNDRLVSICALAIVVKLHDADVVCSVNDWVVLGGSTFTASEFNDMEAQLLRMLPPHFDWGVPDVCKIADKYRRQIAEDLYSHSLIAGIEDADSECVVFANGSHTSETAFFLQTLTSSDNPLFYPARALMPEYR